MTCHGGFLLRETLVVENRGDIRETHFKEYNRSPGAAKSRKRPPQHISCPPIRWPKKGRSNTRKLGNWLHSFENRLSEFKFQAEQAAVAYSLFTRTRSPLVGLMGL